MEEIVKTLEEHMDNSDIFYNKEKFSNGEINLLYIVGLSGSGKSTLSKAVENFPNVEIIEHDLITFLADKPFKEIKKERTLLYTFYRVFLRDFYELGFECPEENKSREKNTERLYDNFNKFALKYSKRHKNKIYIIEGTQSLNSYLDKEFPDIAIIIKNTSFFKSYWRGAKRNGEYYDAYSYKKKIKNIFSRIKKTLYFLFNRQRWRYYKDSIKWITKIKQKIQP